MKKSAFSFPFFIHFKKYLNRKMLAILLLGFSSGLPLALTGSTLQAWMASEKMDLTLIGIFSLVGLPYGLKFLWAPFLDRFVPPFLGRRRGWMLIFQTLLVLTIALLAFFNVVNSPAIFATLAVLISFSSASQDIVVDAYRTEVLTPPEFGLGAATMTFGYRMAMLASGAGALILSDQMAWKWVYLFMAALMSLGIITTLFISIDLPQKITPPKNMKEAIIEPFLEFFRRKGVLEIILFIFIYKLDVAVTVSLMTPFMMELGFTKTDIGAVTKGFGFVATLLGTFVGGLWMIRLGIQKSLWIFGILQCLSGLSFYILARIGYNYPMMVTAIATENFFSGMGNAAYAAFIMMLCHPQFTATQFALLSSIMAMTRVIAQAPTGWLAQTLGWETYYLIAMALAIPGFLLLLRFPIWMKKKNSVHA